MKTFLISKSNDQIVFSAGFIDGVANALVSKTSKLVVISGQPGVGKTEAVKAVLSKMKETDAITDQDIQNLSSLNVAGGNYQAGITAAVESAAALPDVKDSLNIVVWDEVKGDDSEFEAIDQLIGKGYTVVATTQKPGAFDDRDKPNFSDMIEYQGGVEKLAVQQAKTAS